MPTNTCTNTRCDRPATHAVEFPRSSPIDPTPFTRLQCETHARRNVEQLGATMTGLPGVEPDAAAAVEGDALLDAARAYVARWRTVTRFTGAEPVGEAAVRVWYVGPSAARARDGQPIEAEFCEVVGAWELARELAPETVEVEPVTRCAGCGHDADEHINGRAECMVCDCGGVSEPTAERPAGHPAWCQPDQCDRRWSPDNMTRHRAKVDVLVYVTAWQADGEPVAAPVVELLPPDEDLTAEDAREVGQALLRAAELIEGARG